MFSHAGSSFVLVASFILASRSQAQATPSDSVVSRPRQWGAFGSILGYASVGVMRFSSARRAFTLDVDLSEANTRQRVEEPSGIGNQNGDQFYVATRLGMRNYRTMSHEVVSFVGFGPRVALGGSTSKYGSAGRTSATSWEGGGFFDFGVAAAIQRRLLVGATAGATAGYLRSTSKNHSEFPPPGQESRSTVSQWWINAGLLRLEATVLF